MDNGAVSFGEEIELTIPPNIVYQIKKVLGTGYTMFIEGIKSDAEVYLNMYLDKEVILTKEERRLAVSLFAEYRMFSQAGSEISVNKINTLKSLIERINEKNRTEKLERRTVKKGLMVF